MFDMHSKVPQSLKNPATYDSAHSSGSDSVERQSTLQAATTSADTSSRLRLVKRNLKRKRNGNGMLTPTTPHITIISTSSRIRHVSPMICGIAPAYMPPDSWKANAINRYIHGRTHRGTKPLNIGMANGPLGIGGISFSF